MQYYILKRKINTRRHIRQENINSLSVNIVTAVQLPPKLDLIGRNYIRGCNRPIAITVETFCGPIKYVTDSELLCLLIF